MNWRLLGLIASIASILGSIFIYTTHDENLGIFVGLWASALILISERLPEVISDLTDKESSE